MLVLVTLSLAVIYPRVGAYMVRKKLGERLATRLGREIRFGGIDVSLGHAIVRGLEVRGPLDGDTPLVHVDRIDVDFDAWGSLFGSIHLGEAKVDGVVVTLRRAGDGRDNVRDVIDRLTGGGEGGGGSSTASGPRPTRITVSHVRLLANDEQTGATALVGDGDALWTPDEVVAHIKSLTATTTAAPKANVASIEVRKHVGSPPIVKVEGGELALWPRMALSGIGGEIVADPAHPGHYTIDLAGGYGGVGGQLWTAKGDLDPRAVTASIDLVAAKFQLDRLAPILEHSAVVDYQATSVDTALHLDLDRAGASFAGNFHLRGLNVNYWRISDKEVRDLDISGEITGTFDRAARKLDLTQGNFVARDVPFSITGTVVQSPHVIEVVDDSAGASAPRCTAPENLQTVDLRLVIPPINCQRIHDAIPVELAPYLAGYKLKGMFDVDVHLDVDWNNLEATQLDGHVGINHCKVVDEPADSPKRLKDEFEHYVEVEKGEWTSFVVGPTNPDFVPLDQISPYLRASIMSSEDFGFYKHHGFIPSEFKSALVTNLKKCKFAYGASSITMQMVKNVLLTPEKTLARKLQELFLTWHVENTLDKDRIFEIYLNVIEYGPGLYGIGPAAREYFGKAAKDLNPVEAAFFSSILPNPKERYEQYCKGEITKWTTGKIERQLGVMLKRDQLTQEEYDKAMATPLLFVKDDKETEDECLKRVKKAIKDARPTNPNALVEPVDPKKKKKKDKRPRSRLGGTHGP
ncbi:MAG: transglycosylase domain-containing protein [Acidobacteriota bacterium]